MKEPMRVIAGNAKPHEPFWRFVDAAGAGQPDPAQPGGPGCVTIEFDGPISEYSWWGDEITPALFKEELYTKGKGGPVTCLVNSPGGEVVAASVIRSILQEYPGKVTCDITGLCASAATIMVTGADVIRMRESALFMIHDPSAVAVGNVDELLSVVDVLRTVKSSIVDTYTTKTGLDQVQIGEMMSAETWMSARQACDMGFVDEVVTGSICKPKMSAQMGFVNCLANYANVPEGLVAMIEEEEDASQPLRSEENVSADLEANEPESVAAEEVPALGSAIDAQRLRDYLSIFG